MNYIQCLPPLAQKALDGVTSVREIRVRDGQAICVDVEGKRLYVSNSGLSSDKNKAFIFGNVCQSIVQQACHGSVFAYEHTLAQGYFTLDDGSRVGVCGNFQPANGVFVDFSSLCIRVPHEVNCVPKTLADKLSVGNVVFVGAPNTGKTTALRSYAKMLATNFNTVVVDERKELCVGDSLSSCDTLLCAPKQYAFEVAVRTLSPQFLVCDELCEADIEQAVRCMHSGVKLACSVHGSNFDDVANFFGEHISMFAYVVVLNKNHDQTVIEVESMTKNQCL